MSSCHRESSWKRDLARVITADSQLGFSCLRIDCFILRVKSGVGRLGRYGDELLLDYGPHISRLDRENRKNWRSRSSQVYQYSGALYKLWAPGDAWCGKKKTWIWSSKLWITVETLTYVSDIAVYRWVIHPMNWATERKCAGVSYCKMPMRLRRSEQ